MGTVDGPEFCIVFLRMFHIESVGFLVSSPSKYTTWNLRCHIYISRNDYGTNVTDEPLLQLTAVHSFWCVNEDTVWFCVIVSVLWLLSVLVMLISKWGPPCCFTAKLGNVLLGKSIYCGNLLSMDKIHHMMYKLGVTDAIRNKVIFAFVKGKNEPTHMGNILKQRIVLNVM